MTDENDPSTASRELHEDRAWLEGFRRGDRGALERVFRTYVRYISTIFERGFSIDGRAVLGVEMAIEQELAQNVFMKAFREDARLAYDGIRPYGPYLAQIARNELVDHWRRQGAQKRAGEVVGLVGAPEQQAPEAAPDEVAIGNQERAHVKRYIESLSEEDQTFVRLRFEEGLSQELLAKRLGLSRHQIRRRDDQIREGLAKFLREAGDL